jgi:branched-chain amino acid transport system substrate-binding protein
MKVFRLGALAASAAIVLAACGGGASPAPSAAPSPEPGASAAPSVAEGPPTDPLGVVTIPPGEPIHIAFWAVLSGADATLGQDSQYGVQVAIDDKGGKLLDRDIQLTTEDGLCTPEGGATAAQKLAADKTIVGLIGPNCSDEVVGGIKALTDAGMTTISMSATRPALTAPDRGPEYAGFLRTAHSDAFQGKTAAEFVFNELKLKSAATIHDGSAYAQALQGVFADNFKTLGGTITDQEAVAKTDTDMTPVLTKIAATNPDIIYYPIFIAAGGFITAQARQVPGLETTVLMGADGMFSPDFAKAAGPAALNMYLSSPDFSAFGPEYQTFKDKYKALSGGDPLSIFHAHAYDATNILFAAIEKVAVTASDGTLYIGRKALRDAIYASQGWRGITGTLTCGQYGDCGAPVIAVYQITAREVGPPVVWPPEKPIYPQR